MTTRIPLRFFSAISILLAGFIFEACTTVDFYPSIITTSRSAQGFDVFEIRTNTVDEARLAAQGHFPSFDSSHHFSKNGEQYTFFHSSTKNFICVGMTTSSGTVAYAIFRNERRQETVLMGGSYQACYVDVDPFMGISITANPPPDDNTKGLLVEMQ